MKYDDARPLINNGDCVAVVGGHGLALVTSELAKYSHVGIAVWLDNGLWLAEVTRTGNALVPLSKYAQFDVYACPVVGDVKGYIVNDARAAPIKYDWSAWIRLSWWYVVSRWFGYKRPDDTQPDADLCTEFVSNVYAVFGRPRKQFIELPKEVVADMTLKFEVRK